MSTTPVLAQPNDTQYNIKAVVRGMLDELPDDCTLEDVMLALYVRASIFESREQIKAGQGLTLEAAKEEMATWLQSQSLPSSLHN